LEDLRGLSLAVDAFNVLHQFLALIRSRDGKSLTDKEGRVTSHLVGLAFRTTRLISDYKIKLVFVFDGKSPTLKKDEVEKRRLMKNKAEAEYIDAVKSGNCAMAFSKAVQTGRLTSEMVGDSKRLLDLLGVPWVQAPGEGEAQAANMALRGDVWATSTRDYDSLLFGTPRLVRYLTIQGREWLPSKKMSRKLEPELIELGPFLEHYKITREQLIDLAILVGTDFNQGIKGVGPKTALKLVGEYGTLEDMPEEVISNLPSEIEKIRGIFLEPEVSDDYLIEYGVLDEDGIYSFLCGERDFSKDRVEVVVRRMKHSQTQRDLSDWLVGET
jgi:flap endonuclease-1